MSALPKFVEIHEEGPRDGLQIEKQFIPTETKIKFIEALSDTGEITGRGSPVVRGSITGVGTFVGGVLHTLPFLIPHYKVAIISAIVVVAFELVMLAFLRWRYFQDSFVKALASVTLGGIIIAAISAGLGSAA